MCDSYLYELTLGPAVPLLYLFLLINHADPLTASFRAAVKRSMTFSRSSLEELPVINHPSPSPGHGRVAFTNPVADAVYGDYEDELSEKKV